MTTPEPITTDAEYQAALKKLEALMDVPDDGHEPPVQEMITLAIAIEAYEKIHYPWPGKEDWYDL